MEESGQDGMPSPAAPGTGKSKLDTLPKEELIKFAKKQVMLLQKTKSKCTALENEIEQLRTKPAVDANDAVIQELTTRLDSVLLEKAEAQQSTLSLRKELEKSKEELKDTLSREIEFQEEMKSLKNQYLSKIEALNVELEGVQAKHTEEVTRLENELQASNQKHSINIGKLEQQLEIYSVQQTEAKRLGEELNAVKIAYEDHISQLKQQLEAGVEKQKEEIRKLQESHKDAVAQKESKMNDLQKELEIMQISHLEEVTTLKQQLESSVKTHEKELQELEQDLTEKLSIKEKSLENEQITNRTNYECQLNELKEELRKMTEEQTKVPKDIPNEVTAELNEQVKHLENYVKKVELQGSLLHDELLYMKNEKGKLELELYHTREEFFHEREDWEFKINELQLSKEEYMNMVAKLTDELQSANDRCEMAAAQHSYEMQVTTEQNKKDISVLEQTLNAAAEKEKLQSLLEIDNLKVRCQTLLKEKEETVGQYENLRKTMEMLQTELGESASKISYEFEVMKQQQSDEIHDLQQKLRKVFNEKDSLLETINRLQVEVEEAKELKQTVSNLQEMNQELMSSMQKKEVNLNDLQEQVGTLIGEKGELVTAMNDCEGSIHSLKQSLAMEEGKCAELEQQIQVLDKDKCELKQRLDEIAHQLLTAVSEKESTCQQLSEMENRLGAIITEKEHLDTQTKNLEGFIAKLEKEKEALQKEMAMATLQNENLGANEEKLQDLSKQLQILTQERDSLQLAEGIEKQKICDVRLAISSILEQEIFSFTNDAPELDILEAVQLLKESMTKYREEKQSVTLLCDERVLQLHQQLELQSNANRDQQAEFSSLIDDLQKEKTLLQKNLDDALFDKEGLQRDLLELQNLSEKITQENEDLLVQIQNVTEKLENMKTEKQEQNEKTEKETEAKEEQLKCQLNEKESELSKFKEELQKLKELMQKTSNEENILESTIVELNNKMVALEKVSNDKENRINKIKAVAVKAKKELDASKKQVLQLTEEMEIIKSERDRLSSSVKDIMQGAESYKNLLLEYEKQGEKLDMEKTRANNSERQVEELTQHLHACLQQHKQLVSEKEDMFAHLGTLQSNVKQLEAKVLESEKAKNTVEKEFEALKLFKEQVSKENHVLLKDVEELKKQLQNEKQQLQQTTQELELVRKDAQKTTLMDMEIADYERLVKELNQKITDRDNRIVEVIDEMTSCKQKLETMDCEIKSLQLALEEYKEKNTKMKQILVKTKKELTDSKRAEGEQLAVQAFIKGELEANQQQVENYKIQVAELIAENHKLQEQLRQTNEQNHRTVNAFTQKMAALQEECNVAKAEQAATAVDFESYKVRVHNVLKQQKSRSAAQNEHELTQEEKEQLQKVVDQLKAKLQETHCNLQVNAGELQALQLEHDLLLERHNKILQETVSKEAEFREKLCCVQSENVLLKSQHAQTVSQMTAQNEAAQKSFHEQIRNLQEDHKKTVEMLQKQLTKMEAQIFQLQTESSSANSAQLEPSGKIPRDRRNLDISVIDINSIDRGEGEGMEMTETESVSSSNTQVASLEQLLTSPEAALAAEE
ncbi:GRIP and coiled-coil domain-containing protein 2 isoform X2 [Rhincodon typus]|uniref:GRIP and coiled-coil domain-containing protein 2 isoform X2 n=1 Tax=Rhincodon typus TaxID=259920 RepID=UPI00202FE311|nr:GRIP and coiled-coil domain-containing protein 2 isoform X2 [Rhincodon typus]